MKKQTRKSFDYAQDDDTKSPKRFCIVTFGCAQNTADSEKLATRFEEVGYARADSWKEADVIVVNTCMVRQMAEDRVYGLVKNIVKYFSRPVNRYIGISVNRYDSKTVKKKKNNTDNIGLPDYRFTGLPKIIITGCMAGVAMADKTGKIIKKIRERMPNVEIVQNLEFRIKNLELKIQKDNEQHKKLDPRLSSKGGLARGDDNCMVLRTALVAISNGCNNFCTYCVVPYARGREISRSWEEILAECRELREKGVKSVMLLGQNVNSYGSDLIRAEQTTNNRQQSTKIKEKEIEKIREIEEIRGVRELGGVETVGTGAMKPVMVKHLGRYRIPTLFPQLLETVAEMGFENVNFMSSNPWDFSDELIEVISKNANISRTIHLPVQSGDDEVLRRMNRWYTAKQYLTLVKKLRTRINKEALRLAPLAQGDNVRITTDIIVGFPGETEEQFRNTVKLCKKVGFEKAYISLYSPRPMTAATLNFPDDVPHAEKKRRWEILNKLINEGEKGE